MRIFSSIFRSFFCILRTRDSIPFPFITTRETAESVSQFDDLLDDVEDNILDVFYEDDDTASSDLYTQGDTIQKSDGTAFRLPT